jgi:hypothetical protein
MPDCFGKQYFRLPLFTLLNFVLVNKNYFITDRLRAWFCNPKKCREIVYVERSRTWVDL